MLRTVVSLPILYPDHFQSGILAKESIMGVLLYGPPGTGKTMLCRALAHQCGARMIAVKPSNILDMYVGESDKNASAVFSLAHRLAPCVVFIDEVDALFGARSSGSNRDKIHRDILTEFMQAMDGLQSAGINKKKGIVVIGATNRPFDIDQAILRRLPCRVLVDLPDEIQRKNILEGLLKDETCDADLVKIAKDTDGYSGSDLKNLCVSAAMASVKDAIDNFTWNKSSKDTVHPTPTNGDVASRNRTITMTHFSHALSEVVPSFSKNTSEELSRWHRMYSTIPNVMPRGVNNYHHNRANGNAQSRWALS
ncbi:AAA-domain-containing protein [Phlegmacium glaucopus]|nr:AAA-domain-containing protein [Phlegmacium glaucopus]